MFDTNFNRKVVTINDQPCGVLIIPIFSHSKPNLKTKCSRMVFDWGKGLAHPRAKIAFAILNDEYSNWIERLIYEDNTYHITQINKCRSGRLAAQVQNVYPINQYDSKIIEEVLKQEFPDAPKNTV